MALGITLTGYGSIFLQNTPMIPYGVIPDLRGATMLVVGLWLGVYASYGKTSHRSFALVGILAFVIGFHLEEALIHWIGPYPGSITGTPVGLVGTAGSLLAVAALVLIHIDVESAKLSRDIETRGAPRDAGLQVASRLRGEGARRVGALVAGVAALGLVALVADRLVGHSGTGGVYILFVGAGMLSVLAIALVRIGRVTS